MLHNGPLTLSGLLQSATVTEGFFRLRSYSKLGLMISIMFGSASALVLAQPAERIEITGSLIKRLSLEGSTPVLSISNAELAASGVSNAEQAVRFITQQQGGTVTSSSVSGTNGAAAYASLRNLGEQRTLVLLNGKRIVSNPFSSVAVDLNTLPISSIVKVEVLPDGASAIYGTDAIAGVINFITHETYNKTSADVQSQITQHGGGNTYSGGFSFGTGELTKGFNVFGSINFRESRPMLGTARDFSATSYLPERGFNGLSPTTFPANYTQTGTVPLGANPSLAQGCQPPTSIRAPEANGSVIRCFADTQGFTNTIPEQTQHSLFLKGSYLLAGDHKASAEYFRSTNIVTTQIAPSPEAGLSIPPTSPYYPNDPRLDRTRPVSVSWRTVPLGPRQGEQENVTQRLVGSIDGVVSGWDYQASILWSKAEVTNTFLNGYPMTQALRNGAQGASGAPYLNPFGSQSVEGLQYLTQNQVLGQVQDGVGELRSVFLSATRPIAKLAGGDLNVAFAAESRAEEMVYRTDVPKVSQAASSGLAGSGALREGSRDVSAFVAEVVAPIAKGFELGTAIRMDSYSDFGNATNPKFTFRFQPNEFILFRGSANRGFAAPTLTQLYAPQATTFTATRYNDPVLCPNGNVSASGVPSRDCGIQFQRLTGGNTTLTPEESRAWTVGFALQPKKEINLSFDYWNYYVSNSISSLNETAVFGDAAKYADLFVRCSQASAARRDAIGACNIPGGDPLAYIVNTNLNLGDTKTTGFDLQATWAPRPGPMGAFVVSTRATYVNSFEFQVEKGGPWFNPLGNYNAQYGGPVIRHQQITSVRWKRNDVTATLTHRWLSGYTDQNSQGAPFNVAPFNQNRVGAYSIFNLSATYGGFKSFSLQAGILNLFDTDPPFTNQVSRFQARGYDDRFHNPLGRTFLLSVRYEM